MKKQAYLVRRTDNWSGLSIRARTEAEAIRRAQKWALMRGADNYEARLVSLSSRYTVLLSSCGNPDYQQDPDRPLPGVPVERVPAASLSAASTVCREYIERHGLGSGNWSGGIIEDANGICVANVSYNGRVWER